MATVEEAKSALRERMSKYKKKTRLRLAFTGDGRGTGTDNLYRSKNDHYIWVRLASNLSAPIPVLNRGISPDAVGVPVWLGRTEIEPEEEQVLAVNYNAVQDKDDIP